LDGLRGRRRDWASAALCYSGFLALRQSQDGFTRLAIFSIEPLDDWPPNIVACIFPNHDQTLVVMVGDPKYDIAVVYPGHTDGQAGRHEDFALGKGR
jgi:hypothetical protein